MNTFEQIMQNLDKIPQDEKVKLIEAEKAKCICGTVRLYRNAGQAEAGFLHFCYAALAIFSEKIKKI